jgi:hypothetical protein
MAEGYTVVLEAHCVCVCLAWQFLNYTIQYLEEFRDFMDGSGARQRFEQGVTEVMPGAHTHGRARAQH